MFFSCIIFAIQPIITEYVNPLMYFTIWIVNPWVLLYYTIKYFDKLSMLVFFFALSMPLYIIAYFFFITRKVTDHPNKVRIWLRKTLSSSLFSILFCRKYSRLYKKRQNPCYAIIFYGWLMVFYSFFFEIQIYGYVREDNYGDKAFEEMCLYLFVSNLFITMNYLVIEVFVLSVTFLVIVVLLLTWIWCIICK